MKNVFLIFLAAACLIISCKKEDNLPENENPDQNENETAKACNDTLLPLVLIHGFLASGDTYASQAMRFS